MGFVFRNQNRFFAGATAAACLAGALLASACSPIAPSVSKLAKSTTQTTSLPGPSASDLRELGISASNQVSAQTLISVKTENFIADERATLAKAGSPFIFGETGALIDRVPERLVVPVEPDRASAATLKNKDLGFYADGKHEIKVYLQDSLGDDAASSEAESSLGELFGFVRQLKIPQGETAVSRWYVEILVPSHLDESQVERIRKTPKVLIVL